MNWFLLLYRRQLFATLRDVFINQAIGLVLLTTIVGAVLTGQTQLLSIQDAIQAGDLTAASQLIDSSLAKQPNDGALVNLRGVVHAGRNELPAARADFAAATRLSPQLTPAWQNLARACRQLNEEPCAIDAWRRVLRSKPADSEAHASLAEIYADQEHFAESLQHLVAAKDEKLDPLRCLDLLGLGRTTEALTVARTLAKSTDFTEADLAGMHGPLDKTQSAAVLAALVEGLDARRAAGLVSLERLAVAYEQLQRPRDAGKTLERVALLDPTNTAHLLELARLAEASKDHAGALGYLAHARALTPNVARIHFLFGVIAGELNLPVEAKKSLDQALALEPDDPDYNYAMGRVILTTRDAAKAASYFAKFVKAYPADGRGHFALGLAQFTAGDYATAKQEMLAARKSPSVAAGAEYYLGRIARLDGNLDEATRRLQAALALDPKFSEPHTELARIALLNENLPAAHAQLEWALQLAPDDFQTNEQLLVLYTRMHDPRAAAQAALLKKLDEERSKRAELMLRTLEMRP